MHVPAGVHLEEELHLEVPRVGVDSGGRVCLVESSQLPVDGSLRHQQSSVIVAKEEAVVQKRQGKVSLKFMVATNAV